MFKKGEFILYGTVGVCQVEKISRTDFSDNDRLYYYLVPRYEKDTTICIPVDSDKVMMREYANDRERPQAYKEAIQSGDCLELASMIKEISRMEQSRKGKGRILSVREKDGAKAARRLLFGELAAALDIYPEEVPGYIEVRTGFPCQ